MSTFKTTWSSGMAHVFNQKEISQQSTAFFDPAIDALFKSLKHELDYQRRIVDKQRDKQRDKLEGIAYSPISPTGLKLVQRCSALWAENHELGNLLHNGCLENHKMEIVIRNKLINELQVALKESYAYAASLEREIEALQNELINCKAKHTSA